MFLRRDSHRVKFRRPASPAACERLEERALLSTLVIDDPAVHNLTLGVTSVGGVKVVEDGAETDYAPQQWDSVSASLSSGGSAFVTATIVPVTVAAPGGEVWLGEVSTFAAAPHGMQDILGPVTVASAFSFRMNDGPDSVARNVTVSSVSLGGDAYGLIQGLAPAQVEYRGATVANVQLFGGIGGDDFTINSTPPGPAVQQPTNFDIEPYYADQQLTATVRLNGLGPHTNFVADNGTQTLTVDFSRKGIGSGDSIAYYGNGRGGLAVIGAGLSDPFTVYENFLTHGDVSVVFPRTRYLDLRAGTFDVVRDLNGLGLIVADTSDGNFPTHVIFDTSESLDEVAVDGPGLITVPVSSIPGGKSLVTPELNMFGGTLDIGNNQVVLPYTVSGLSVQLMAAVRSGYDGGHWDGAGIVSSAIDSRHGIAVIDNQDQVVSWLPSHNVIVRWATYGDTNLDGRVDLSDLLHLARNYGRANVGWWQGDFNYDGKVDMTDLLQLAQNYGTSAAAATPLLITGRRRRS